MMVVFLVVAYIEFIKQLDEIVKKNVEYAITSVDASVIQVGGYFFSQVGTVLGS